ncbi:aldehyde dehydrogenase family protein [Celeribacter sp. PS-C1]|nr:aldehyde dehydrogenase family protein [Celeribacter sp. PS-C1]
MRYLSRAAHIECEGFCIVPIEFADVADDMTIAREEIFRPFMAVLEFEYKNDVITRANGAPYGLSAGVFTQDIIRARRIIANFEGG